MPQKPIGGVEFEVDSQNRLNSGPLATEAKQDAIIAAEAGAGLPIPMTFADPGSDAYTAAQATTRATTRLRAIVGNSGVVISLDGGATASISLPPNCMDEMAVNIPAGTLIKVKRYTASVAWSGLILEVR